VDAIVAFNHPQRFQFLNVIELEGSASPELRELLVCAVHITAIYTMSHCSKPLDPRRKEIRRLILQPVSAGTEIRCSTETVSLLEQPEYEALSYVWGDMSVQRKIIFDGMHFPITENLAIALHHLRLPDKPRRVWVDALCINQSNTKERNEQVILMGEIYTKANPVLIWLGEASEGSDEAFASMSTITEGNDVSEEISKKMFAFYMGLVEREWFTRLWTVQELALASQDPLVGCGFTWITWSTLLGAWQKGAMREFSEMEMIILGDGDENNKDEGGALSGVRPSGIKIDLLNNLRTAVANKGGEELQDLLLNTNSSKATEPRDRIYALLGMMRSENRKCVTVDYGRPLGTVFAEAVAYVFQKGNGPFLLSGMKLAGTSQQNSFPSWVPTFGSSSLLSPTSLHPPGVGASGAGSNCTNGIVAEDLKTLRVRGLPVDIIIDKISFRAQEECLTQLSQVEALTDKARQLAALHSNHRPYLNKFKTKEPVWRTLVANKAYSGAARQAAPESYSEMYNMMLRKQDSTGSSQEFDDEFVRDYRLSLLNHLPSGCFFITASGFYGISQVIVEAGDHLAIWFGSPAPFVLRQASQGHCKESERFYGVLGVAYVSGIMDGEMVDEVYCEDLEDDVVFTVR
jgi:hypothetical protein